MPDWNRLVTVVNRTSKTLPGTWDGRHYDIKPGEHMFTILQAKAFRHQNPIMGHGTPFEDWNSRPQYLIAIKDEGDDCSPIEQSDAPQRWDTSLVTGNQWDIVRARAGVREQIRQPQPPVTGGTGFGKA